MVDALWTSYSGFNETNVQDLFNKINGASGTTFAQIQSLANSKMTASQIRAKTYGKTSSQDIEVVLGGLEWEVVYLSTDTDGNAILTLWLDNNQQPGWTGKSQTEGAFYGFYNGGLYSDWSADWYNASFTSQTYPSTMYGTSYIRAVTLNNGGGYVATSGASSLMTASQNPNSVFAPFTMSSSGLYEYIVSPNKVSWQLDQTARGSDYANMTYDLPNDSLNNPTGANWDTSSSYGYGSPNMTAKTNYKDWGADKLWLPSMAETGYNTSYDGMWNLSVDQRKNFDGSTTSISRQKVGSSNTQNTSSLSTFSWLRSGFYDSARNAYTLNPSGSNNSNTFVNYSDAVRPALHLNLAKVADAVGLTTWTDYASGKDFANSGHAGTVDDPYLIESAEDLAQLAVDVNGGNKYQGNFFQQTTNIFLGGLSWIPIGSNSTQSFAGNYDGKNFRIEGITINTTADYQGLFGYCSYATIKNIILQSGSISGASYIGGIAGYNLSGTISGCINRAVIKGTRYAGGITGFAGSTINDCTNYGNITSTGDYAGGICASGGGVKNCHNYGDISGASYIGGIAATSSGTIENCISSCTITATGSYVGGLLGTGYHPDMRNCSAYGHLNLIGSGSNRGTIWGLCSFYGDFYGCSFYGTSTQTLNMGYFTSYAGYTTVSSACWAWCNNKIQVSSNIIENPSTWTQYWAIVENINDSFPVQKAMYTLADVVNTTAQQLSDKLQNATVYNYNS